MTGPAIVVARNQAEAALRLLLHEGVLDGMRRAFDGGGEVHLPVRADAADLDAWAQRVGGRLEKAAALEPREPTLTPREKVVARLRGVIPDELLPLVPEKWEQHGDVLVVRMDEPLLPHARAVAAAFAEVLRLKSVLQDASGVAGELREMRARFIFGDDALATHVENGVKYRFDASRVMFSSGNVEERRRAAHLPARGETVVDMFAGIGYFTLPLAMHARPAKVHAIEKNPVSFAHLVENVRLNGADAIVEPWLGDNRDFPHEAIADRVLMGYFPGTSVFLPKAMRLLKSEGGIVHYHNTAHERSWKEEMTRAVLDAARACGAIVHVESARVVKSHSPGVVHAVLDVRVRRPSGGAAH